MVFTHISIPSTTLLGGKKVWPIPPPHPYGAAPPVAPPVAPPALHPGTVCSARWPISCAATPTNIRAIASAAANICWTTRRRSQWSFSSWDFRWFFCLPIGSMYAIYMVTFTINIPPMLAYIPYMDPMGMGSGVKLRKP